MINLLPTATKDQISFARRNTVLRNWVFASLLGLASIVIVILAGQIFISKSTANWQGQLDDIRTQLNEQKLEDTQRKVTDISDSFKLTLQVLSREILFSKLISQIGAAIPAGSSLQNLSISSNQGGIDITAGARDYQTATQVQINLSDPENKIFEKADIVSVNCTPQSSGNQYPCSIVIRALFAQNNEFQYVSNEGSRSSNE